MANAHSGGRVFTYCTIYLYKKKFLKENMAVYGPLFRWTDYLCITGLNAMELQGETQLV